MADQQEVFTLSETMSALIFDTSTNEFGLVMPRVENEDDTVPPQVMALAGCLMLLNSSNDFIDIVLKAAYDKFEQFESMDQSPRIHIPE